MGFVPAGTRKDYIKFKDGKAVMQVLAKEFNKDPNPYQELADASGDCYEFMPKNGKEKKVDIRFGAYEATLKKIELADIIIDKAKGTKRKLWNIALEDVDSDGVIKEVVWSEGLKSYKVQGLVNSLLTIEGSIDGVFRFTPYLAKNDKGTNVSVRYNGEKLSWKYGIDEMDKLAPITDAVDGDGEPLLDDQGNQMKDFRKRIAWVKKQVEIINVKLQPKAEEFQDEDPY